VIKPTFQVEDLKDTNSRWKVSYRLGAPQNYMTYLAVVATTEYRNDNQP